MALPWNLNRFLRLNSFRFNRRVGVVALTGVPNLIYGLDLRPALIMLGRVFDAEVLQSSRQMGFEAMPVVLGVM
jgi:hypothetical protein